jgi:hypothetical protein
VRYELPPGLDEEHRIAVEAALRQYLDSFAVRPSPWALAGRAEGCAIGALQIRHQSKRPWNEIRLGPYTRRGTVTLRGRGDAR